MNDDIQRDILVHSRSAESQADLLWSAICVIGACGLSFPLAFLGVGWIGALLLFAAILKTIGAAVALREALDREMAFDRTKTRRFSIRQLEGSIGMEPIAEFPEDLQEAIRHGD